MYEATYNAYETVVKTKSRVKLSRLVALQIRSNARESETVQCIIAIIVINIYAIINHRSHRYSMNSHITL